MRPLMTWPRFVASALAIALILGVAWCAPDLNSAVDIAGPAWYTTP